MDVYGEQSWWNFSCDLYISLFDGRPKRHRSDLQMSLWMEILSREKLLCSFILSCFWQPYECVTGVWKVFWVVVSRYVWYSLCFSIFFFISFVVGSLWVVLRSSSVIWRSLWVVVGRCGSFQDLVTTGPSDENQITWLWTIPNRINFTRILFYLKQ